MIIERLYKTIAWLHKLLPTLGFNKTGQFSWPIFLHRYHKIVATGESAGLMLGQQEKGNVRKFVKDKLMKVIKRVVDESLNYSQG